MAYFILGGGMKPLFTSFFVMLLLLTGCTEWFGKRVVSYPRHETLYIGGHEWSEPHNFNPLNSWPVTWPATVTSNLLFE